MLRINSILFTMLFSFISATDLKPDETSKAEAEVIGASLKFTDHNKADDGGEKSSKIDEKKAVQLKGAVTSGAHTTLKLADLPLEVIDTCIGSFCGKEEVKTLRATSIALNVVFTPVQTAMKSIRKHYSRIMAGLFFDELRSANDLDIILYPIRGMSPGRLLSHLEVKNKLDRKEVASKLSRFAEKSPTVGLEDLEDAKDGSFLMVQYKDLGPSKQKLTEAIKSLPNIRLQVVVEVSTNKEDSGTIVWDNGCLPAGVKHLELVHVGSRAKKLPDNAFSGIRRLESLILPDSVELIGDSVCFLCTELKRLKAKGVILLGNLPLKGQI